MLCLHRETLAVRLLKQGQQRVTNRSKRGGLCFITTAVCSYRGLEDNCMEHNTLRVFRDEYLLRTPDGKALVEEYSRIAPEITVRMKHPDDLKYAWDVIQICVNLIKSKENDQAIEEYKKMVYALSEKLLANSLIKVV